MSPIIFESEEGKWAEAIAVTCVECPKCAFTFDATHEDKDGGYSCPQCDQLALQAEVERLTDLHRKAVAEAVILLEEKTDRDEALSEIEEWMDEWSESISTMALCNFPGFPTFQTLTEVEK